MEYQFFEKRKNILDDNEYLLDIKKEENHNCCKYAAGISFIWCLLLGIFGAMCLLYNFKGLKDDTTMFYFAIACLVIGRSCLTLFYTGYLTYRILHEEEAKMPPYLTSNLKSRGHQIWYASWCSPQSKKN